MDWPEENDFRMLPEEEVVHAQEGTLYNKLPENEKQYALFTYGPCCIVGKHRRRKVVLMAEMKAIQMALDTAE